MTPNRPHQALSLVLSLLVSLALFSGVSSLAVPDHAAPVLVQTPAATPTAS
jgi:hypothetical protein